MYLLLKPHIKDLMKKKGLSYRDLGRKIGITESGVKKLFQASDCSLSRLEQIAEALGTDLSTLLLYAREESVPEQLEISSRAQAELRKKPLLMDIYWLLLVEDLSPAEVLARYKISRASLYACLNELDRLKLIVWRPGDRIQAAPQPNFLVKAEGPLVQYWTRRFSESMIEDYENEANHRAPREKSPMLAQRVFELKPETARELRQRLEDLFREFALRSVRDKSLGRGRTFPVRVSAGYAAGSMLKALK